MSAGIVNVMMRTATIVSAAKTIAMPIPRRMRRSSSHWTAGLMVPTITRAATRTRSTGRSRFSIHIPAMSSTKAMTVPGEGSMRSMRRLLSFGGVATGILCDIMVSSIDCLPTLILYFPEVFPVHLSS